MKVPHGLPNHCHGAHLWHRLDQENGFFEAACSRFPEWSALRPDFEAIFAMAVAGAESGSEGVAAHGDYHPQNLVLTDSGTSVPFDGMDFGLAHPGYDLANPVFELEPARIRRAFAWYKAALAVEVAPELPQQGLSTACILRAGGNLRQQRAGPDAGWNFINKARETIVLGKGHTTGI